MAGMAVGEGVLDVLSASGKCDNFRRKTIEERISVRRLRGLRALVFRDGIK